MALKDFMARAQGPENVVPEPQPFVAPAASRVAAPSPQHSTYLGAGTKITGEVHCGESLRIDGSLKGSIHCDQLLTVGEKGSIHAAIEGETVVIAGEVQGDIKASRKITLEATARVTGDLTTPGIVIQEGARLEGRIMIGGAPAAARGAAAQAPAPEKSAEKAPERRAAGPGEPPARPPVIASGA